MSNIAEPAFNEYEERYFLAEILKSSNLPPAILLNLIIENGVEPAWNDIALPRGRSLSACRTAYQTLIMRSPSMQDPRFKKKRPLPIGEPIPPTERTLQPRPSAFAPVNTPEQSSPLVFGDNGRPTKKRGRPSKEETSRRVAEAAERGEVYQPKVRKKPAQRQSTGGVETVEVVGGSAPTAVMFTPEKTVAPAAGSPGSSTMKQWADTAPLQQGLQTTGSAGRIQPETGVREGVASEQQMSGYSPQERLITSLQQHAATTDTPDVQMGESEASPATASGLPPQRYGPVHGLSFPPLHTSEAEQRSATIETPTTTTSQV